MNGPEQSANNAPTSELRGYVDAAGGRRVDEIFKAPGDRFNLGKLGRGILTDPTAFDSGSAAVQTMESDGQRRTFYTDGVHLIDGSQPDTLVKMSEIATDDPSSDIVIGQSWQSPFGSTGEVVGVAIPWIHGELPGDARITSVPYSGKPSSLTEIGRLEIDRRLEAADQP